MHAHNVFFSLKDKSPEKIGQLVTDSKKYLAVLPGIKFFECGLREVSLERDVNDLDFDVSLHVLFESLETHDAYQESASHHEFVVRNQANWASARVFDAVVT